MRPTRCDSLSAQSFTAQASGTVISWLGNNVLSPRSFAVGREHALLSGSEGLMRMCRYDLTDPPHQRYNLDLYSTTLTNSGWFARHLGHPAVGSHRPRPPARIAALVCGSAQP
jgi:hypothetical protein